jgi:hypothetical protein
MVVPPPSSLEPDPQILVFLYLVDDHPVQGPMRNGLRCYTEADSLALGCMIMVWLLTVFAAIRHLRSQATI